VYGPPAPPNLPPTINLPPGLRLPTTKFPTNPSSGLPKINVKPPKPFWQTEKFKAIAARVLNSGATVQVAAGLSIPQRNAVRPPIVDKGERDELSASRFRPALTEAEYDKLYGASDTIPTRYNPAAQIIAKNKQTLTEKMYPTPESSGRDTGPVSIYNLEGQIVPYTSQTAIKEERMRLINEGRLAGKTDEEINSAIAVYDLTIGIQKFAPFNTGTWGVEEVADIDSPAFFPATWNMMANGVMYGFEYMRKNWELQFPIRVSSTTGKWVLQIPVTTDNVSDLRAEQQRLQEMLLQNKETVGPYYSEREVPLSPERRAELQDKYNYLSTRIEKAKDDDKRASDAMTALKFSYGLSAKSAVKWYDHMSKFVSDVSSKTDWEKPGSLLAIGKIALEGAKSLLRMDYYDTPADRAAAEESLTKLSRDGAQLYTQFEELQTTGMVKVSDPQIPLVTDVKRQAEHNAILNERVMQILKRERADIDRLTPEKFAEIKAEIMSDPDLRGNLASATTDDRIIERYMDEYEASFNKIVKDLRLLPTSYAEVYSSMIKPAEFRPATEQDFKDMQDRLVELKMAEQDIRYKLEGHNPMNSATWVREPWREEIFRQNLALTEIQLGRPVTLLEVRQIKQQYYNMATEFAYEMVFDILNIVEPIDMLDSIAPGFKFGREVFAKSLKNGFLEGIRKVWGIGWFMQETISTQASKRANLMNDVLNAMRVAYPGNMKGFTDDLTNMAGLLYQSVGKSDDEIRAIYKTAQDSGKIKGMANISFDRFRAMRDLTDAGSGGISPEMWKVKYEEALANAEQDITSLSKKMAIEQSKQMEADALRMNLPFTPHTESELGQMAAQISADLMSTPTQTGIAQNMFVEEFKSTFERPYRLHVDPSGRSSRMMTDTLYGQITKKLRLLGGQVADMPVVERLEAVAKKNALDKNGQIFWSELFDGVLNRKISFGEAWDMKILNAGRKLSPGKQTFYTGLASFMEFSADAAARVYSLWAMSVLSLNPRWAIQNLIDSAGRSFIYGGNPFGDVAMLYNGMHKHLIAEMGGELPIELIQMARSGIEFSDSVPGRLLFSDFRPGMTPLSFWKAEKKRLAKEMASNIERSAGQVPSVMAATQNLSPLAKTFRALWDGFGSSISAIPASISDYNTAIEFTVRLRMFHREYFKILDQVEPLFKNLGKESLSAPVNKLVSRLWTESGGNSAKLRAMVDDIVQDLSIQPVTVKNYKGMDIVEQTADQLANQRTRAWSILFNDDIDYALKSFTSAEKVNFLSDLSDNFHEMRKYKMSIGEDITDADIDKFIDEYRDNMRENIMTQMDAQLSNTIGNMDAIGLAPKVSKFPNPLEIMKDAANKAKAFITSEPRKLIDSLNPFVSAVSQSPGQAAVKMLDSATKELNSRKLITLYAEALAPMGTVIEKAGGLSRVFAKDGAIIIQIGSDLIAKSPKEVMPVLREMTIRAMAIKELPYLRAEGMGVEAYVEAMKMFIGDARGPVELLARDERAYRIISNAFELDPHLRKALEALQGGREIKYGAEAILSSRFEQNEAMLFPNSPEFVEALKDHARHYSLAPSEALVAGDRKAMATQKLFDVMKTLPLEQQQKVQNFLNRANYLNGQLAQFRFHSGPGMFSARNPLRGKAWDLFWVQRTKDMDNDARRTLELVAMLKGNPNEAVESFLMNAAGQPYTVSPESAWALLDEYEAGFTRKFLEDRGFSNIGEDNFGHLSHFSMNIPHKDYPAGKVHNFYRGQRGTTRIVEIAEGFFFSDKVRRKTLGIVEMKPGDLLHPGRDVRSQLRDALLYAYASQNKSMTQRQATQVALVMDSHIKEIVRLGGGQISYEDVMRRFGFARVKGPSTYADNLSLAREALDRVMIFGFGNQNSMKGLIAQMSNMFYKDLAWLTGEVMSPEAMENLRTINNMIYTLSGSKVLSGSLTPYQSEVFAEIFEKYVVNGTGSDIRGAKKAFESFRGFIARSFKDVNADNILNVDVTPEMFVALDRIFMGTKLAPPQANEQIINLMAKQAGLKLESEDILAMVNNHAAVSGFGQESVNKIVKSLRDAGFKKQDAEQLTELMWAISQAKNPDVPDEWLKSWNIMKADGDVDIMNLYRASRGSELMYEGIDRTYAHIMSKTALETEIRDGIDALPRLRIDMANADTVTERLVYLSAIAGHSERGEEIAEIIFNELRKSNLVPDNLMYQRMAPPVDSPKFKAWFENSVVRDAEGKPMVMYHGGGSVFDAFDIEKDAGGNLFGPGFYFTDTPEVASGYAEGSARQQYTGNGQPWNRQATTKEMEFINGFFNPMHGLSNNPEYRVANAFIFSQSGDPTKWEMIKNLPPTDRTKILQDRFIATLAETGLVENPKIATNPNILPVYMSIQNPFDIDKTYTKDMIMKIFTTKSGNDEFARRLIARTRLDRGAEEAVTGESIWRAMEEGIMGYTEGEAETNAMLQEFGFDGITHIGGRRVGNQEHRVYIAFEPTQVKSVSNGGEWSKTDPRLLMQRELDEQGADDFVRAIFQFAEKEGNLEKELLYNVRNAVSDTEQIKILSSIHNRDSALAERIYQELYRKGGLQFQTEMETTPAFKAWFSNSKVLHEDGSPMVLYHGTTKDFTEFNLNAPKTTDDGWFGKGLYFTPSTDSANVYSIDYKAGGMAEGSKVLPVYVNITNPFDFFAEQKKVLDTLSQFSSFKEGDVIRNVYDGRVVTIAKGDIDSRGAFEWVLDSTPKSIFEDMPSNEAENAIELTKRLQALGYDGVFVRKNGELREVVAFEPTQVKSIYNQGTFDSSVANLLLQKRGNARGAFWTTTDSNGNIQRWTALVKGKAKVDTFIHEVVGHGTLDDIMKTSDWRTKAVENWSGIPEGSYAGLVDSNKIYNDAKSELFRPDLTDERKKILTDLVDQHRPNALKYVEVQERFANGAVTYIKTGFAPTEELRKVFEYVKQMLVKIWNHLKDNYPDLDDEMIKVYDSLFKEDPSKIKIARRYTSLGDVPLELAEDVLKITKAKRVSNELNAAFQVFKKRTDISMFPDSVTGKYETFRRYLYNKVKENGGIIEDNYRNIIVQLENFADGVTRLHHGDELDSFLNPVLPAAQMGESAKTLIAHNVDNMKILEGMEQALEEARHYWKAMRANNGQMIPNLTMAEKEDLVEWGKTAARNKADMMNLVINGGVVRDEAGKVIAHSEGALPKTNKVLLDYNTRTNLDAMMKNFFPFWMFPSRSLPFWAGAMIEHPAIPAMYFRIKRASESARYQAGAIDSQGRPLSSLDGYVPVPGTDMWFNPLAPFSFRYILDITKSWDNLRYRKPETEEALTGFAYVVKEFMTSAPLIGFNLSPWTAYMVKESFGISDDVLPQWSLAPQFNLIPKWAIRPYVESDWGNPLFNGARDFAAYWLFPEPAWQDALIEQQILRDYNAKYGDLETMTPEAAAARKLANDAIVDKGSNPLWVETYKKLTQDDATRNLAAFFSGVYTKTFTDAAADLIAIKLDSRALRQAMNNQFVATMTDMPLGDEDRWEYYLNKYRYADNPEAWTARMYTDIGWVKNEDGKVVTDPEERARLLKVQVEMTENSRRYYFIRKEAVMKLQADLAKLPVGSSGQLASAIYDAHYAYLAKVTADLKLPEYVYYVNSNKPISLVERDLRDQWWYLVKSTMPEYNMDFKEYTKKMQDWEASLPMHGELLGKTYYGFYMEMYSKFSEDQVKNMNKNLIADLIKETTQEGYKKYRLENDTIVDAANEAWRVNYWDKYWDAVEGLSGDRRRLAELEFQHQNPTPDEAKIYNWIGQIYGEGRFTYGQVKALMGASPENETQMYFDPESRTFKSRNVLSVNQRLDAGKTKEQLAVNNIYNILGWAGPTTGRAVLEQAYILAGGQADDFKVWYSTGGTGFNSNPAKLLDMERRLKIAAANLDLNPPKGAALRERIKAADLKDKFELMVAVDPELGPDFLRYPDPENGIEQGIYSEYSNTSFDMRKAWKKKFPESWEKVQHYKKLQEQYARENPLYAAYYTDFTDFKDIGVTFAEPADTTTTTTKPKPTAGQPAFWQPTETPENVQQKLPTDTIGSQSLAPERSVSKLAVIPWPKGFTKTVGKDILSEITNLYKNGVYLSQPAKDYLYDLARRHREWRGFIYSALQR